MGPFSPSVYSLLRLTPSTKTYAMAFYLGNNNQTGMLEDNQKCVPPLLESCTPLTALDRSDLEQAVESLAELLERPLVQDKISELRQQMTDKTVYVQRRCQVMLEDTLRGYDEVLHLFG